MATAKGQRKSTIYDIATSTGTSPATVSMVLNGTWQRYRISEATATRILDAARTLGYNVNMKARGLRLARSGLAGMIMPHYRNRFFAGLSETFEAGARARGFCPMVVSTQRNPETEREVVERLLSHQVEFLFIVGVANPEPLNELCRAANIPCVNIDLPGANAPSVVTDNQGGARMLTDILLDKIAAPDPSLPFPGRRRRRIRDGGTHRRLHPGAGIPRHRSCRKPTSTAAATGHRQPASPSNPCTITSAACPPASSSTPSPRSKAPSSSSAPSPPKLSKAGSSAASTGTPSRPSCPSPSPCCARMWKP